MPTDEWKRNNPKVSGHIPKDLKRQLDQFIEDRGLKGTSEALRIILEKHFNSGNISKSSQLVDNSLQIDIEAMKASLEKNSKEIEKLKKSKVRNSESPQNTKSSQLVRNSSQLSDHGRWLTTGEAFSELQKLGYEKSQGTFRRVLKKSREAEKVPSDLESIGLVADFKMRNQANPKDNSVRWLRINKA